MSNLLKQVANLSPEKRELLLQRLNKEGRNHSQPQIKRQNRESNSFPLSFAQERLWFLNQLEPDSSAYNIPTAVRLKGSLNVMVLAQSLNEVIQCHEALRTTFATMAGQPVQVISPSLNLTLPTVDLRQLSESQQKTEVLRLATQEAQRPFPLDKGPLLRVTLLQLSQVEHVVLFTMHHIVSDGWSTGVLVRELAALYEALSKGKPISCGDATGALLPELPIQYVDFAVWQRQWLQGRVLESQLTYWKQQLSNTPDVLELPTDHPRPAIQTNRGATQSFILPKELSEALKSLSRQEEATLFMTLLAAFKVLLHRYTQQNDIAVGTPIANRNRSETEGLIGFFVNTLVLRTQLTGNLSFRQLLKQVREVALGAYAHQDLPFEQLVEELQPERNLSHSSLFQVMFILQNAPTEVLKLPGLTLSTLTVESKTASFDLTLSMADTEQWLKGTLEYNTDLFEAARIDRILQQFQVLLQGVVANPDQCLSDLPILTPAEQQLLVEWNHPQTVSTNNQCIHQLFEAQVEQTPDAIAVVFEDQHLTYRALNQRANQLAHRLGKLGVEPEVLVGLHMERSPELVVGLLGILKAGGAYLPLDPAYPQERLAFMLANAQVPILITQAQLLAGLPVLEAQVICLDDANWDLIAQESQENPASWTTDQNLAYAIYTSGSTGQSKGVMIQHHSLVNAYLGWESAYHLQSVVRCHLQMASFSFDVFLGDLVRALGSGGKLVLCPRDLLLEPKKLYELMLQQQVDCAEFVPAVLRNLIYYLEQTQQRLDFMQLLVCGSDNWSVGEYQKFQSFCGSNTRLVNSFGLTEATIDSSYFESVAINLPIEQGIPIGRPFANTQFYILDSHLQRVPIGVPGELYIGGVGLARGYLNRPTLTAEAFIPNPFSNQPGTHLYQTGDLAHYLPDGNIQLLGRIDYQVKIRGFRIELGEVEAALKQHPAVQEAVVVAREDKPGNKCLVAYVVQSQKPASNLQGFLREQLPSYMVPTAFVLLETLPLTPNGKIDRRALPAPDIKQSEREGFFVAPRSPIEEVLAGIWGQVLGIEQVGIYNNFFELGGHSLLATQVISRLRQAFQVELPLRCLFESPTVAGLAEHIETTLKFGQGLAAPPIKPISQDGVLPLSFAQERLWFLNQLEPDSAAYNIPAAMHLRGSLDGVALERSLNEIVQRHAVLRTTFVTVEGQPVQVVAPNLTLVIPVVDLQGLSEKQREIETLRIATEEAQRLFNLQGPLLRGTLLQLDEADHVVLFTMHHIISDGWSMGVLVRELAVLYEALSKGKSVSGEAARTLLPELPIQYTDFALWQRQWLQGRVLESQLAYWKQQLSNAPAVLELPTDRPRPAVQTNRGATQFLALSKSLTEALKTLSQQESVTLFMALLAALKVLLHRYTQQDDIVVGTPIANRNRSETEGLIGFFVNTLVLRTQFSSNLSFQKLLEQVREVALGAYAHQDLPFEQLVTELQPERNLSHNPLFQVMFVFQNVPTESLELPGLTLNPLEFDNKTANFDLTLSMVETEQGLRGALEYNTDLFEATRITRMLSHFQLLLEGIVANPNQRLSELPLLGTDECHQFLVEWNNTQADYPQEQCIHQLVEAQVKQTPDAIAVVLEDQHLTYQVLNQRANQLAHFLQKLGVGPEVRVGLCLERAPEMIIGLLGILKAGGAYVPLDPTYPQERLAFMLTDAQVPVLLTQACLVAGLPEPNTQVLCLDTDWDAIAQQPQNNPAHRTVPENLAYVIYTSGSTGQPKGVMIQHRSLVNQTKSAVIEYKLAASDRILQFASISFDAAAEEILPCLAQGATLILRTNEMLNSLPGFLQQCQDLKLTVLDLPTAFWHQLTSELAVGLALPESLRLIIIGGESALPEYLAIWRQVGTQVRLVNSYGPTEATVVAVTCDLSGVAAVEHTVPIGQPIRNLQTYVLDPSLNPVPIGVPGELYIGGVGLARGYLNQPLLSAEKFIPNPFSPEPGARLYQTGDRVRYRSDGNMEFLGRMDQQVKIRGFRIEIGEIEAVLRHHGAVQAVVVLAREDSPGQKRLVAYVVLDRNQTPTARELRRFLQGKLPDYLVPSAFVSLETLPLTANGKVDRRALPVPDAINSEVSTAFVAPRTFTEERLVAIWAEVLGLDQVSVHDNFFELGGHSLLMTQLLTRVRDTFHVDLSLRSLFEAPTVAGLAEVIEVNCQAGFSPPSDKQTAIDWEAESVLDSTIYPETVPVPSRPEPACIFLTGATGFLGAFLLYELLQQTQAEIHCLVRAASPEEGNKKLRSHLESYLLWHECFNSRIISVIGDLSQPLLGLSEEQFQLMAGKLDVIYHNGAWVHHIYPYSILKAANVLGTQEVLRLACRTKAKPVHFISTPSVFSLTGHSGVRVIREQDSLNDSAIPADGYSQSKWVAERLVTTAQERGLPVCVYRPGRISGHSQTGVFNPNDFLYKLIIGCVQLGSAPDEDIREDIVPVDYVSRAIVHLSKHQESLGKAFHLVNPCLLHSSMLINVTRSFGYPLREISYNQWRAELIKVAGHSPEHALYPLIPFFSARHSNHASKTKSLEKRSKPPVIQFDCQNTLNGLAGTSIICPSVDEQLLSTYFSYLIQNGFLEALQPKAELEP
jgi:amino acid adenylation domain-containing protein/thioester reductase-like protein